jgi:cytidylate kinase
VLRDEKDVFKIFIYGDLEHRKERVHERHPEIKTSQLVDVINKTDRRRSSYYNFYTGNKWGKYDNYDMAINSSNLGIEGTAQLITICARELMNKTERGTNGIKPFTKKSAVTVKKAKSLLRLPIKASSLLNQSSISVI